MAVKTKPKANISKMPVADFIKLAIRFDVLRADLNTGLVYNNRLDPSKPLGTLTRRGYLVATVHMDGERKQVKLHQVVWFAAGRAIPGGRIIDHENRIKTDNRLDNLRLATPLLNSQNRRSYKGEGNPAARIDRRSANAIRESYTRLHSYGKVAAEFSVSRSLVAQIVRGELWQ